MQIGQQMYSYSMRWASLPGGTARSRLEKLQSCLSPLKENDSNNQRGLCRDGVTAAISGLLQRQSDLPCVSLLHFQQNKADLSVEDLVTDRRTYCLLILDSGLLFAAGKLSSQHTRQ